MNKNQRIENEGQILKLVSEGDSQAFRTLYMHYYDRLFNFACCSFIRKPHRKM